MTSYEKLFETLRSHHRRTSAANVFAGLAVAAALSAMGFGNYAYLIHLTDTDGARLAAAALKSTAERVGNSNEGIEKGYGTMPELRWRASGVATTTLSVTAPAKADTPMTSVRRSPEATLSSEALSQGSAATDSLQSAGGVITLTTSHAVTGTLEAIPGLITLDLDGVHGQEDTMLSVSGLQPNTEYHRYLDHYGNHTPFVTDAVGAVSFAVDLQQRRVVFIQPRPSTYFLTNGVGGGDCEGKGIGIWNEATKTCTLTGNATQTIQIGLGFEIGDGVTLDGAGYTVYGGGNGIYVYGASNVTITNIVVESSSIAVSVDGFDVAHDITLSDVTTTNNYTSLYVKNADAITVRDCTFEDEANGPTLSFTDDVTLENIHIEMLEPAINGTIGDLGMWIGPANRVHARTITIQGGYLGLLLSSVTDDDLRDITVNGAGTPYSFSGSTDAELAHEIRATIDGAPLVYTSNRTDAVLDGSVEHASILYCMFCKNTTVRGYDFNSTITGLWLYKADNVTVEDNTFRTTKGHALRVRTSSGVTVRDNVFYPQDYASMYFDQTPVGATPASVYHNAIHRGVNTGQYVIVEEDVHHFAEPLPVGGNWWEQYDTPEEGCADADGNHICDDPYIVDRFTSPQVVDTLPWTSEGAWENASQGGALVFPSEAPYDGVRAVASTGPNPEKGVANKDVFTFKVVYTSEENTAPTSVRIEALAKDVVYGKTLFMQVDGSAPPALQNGNFTDGEQYVATDTFPKGSYTYHVEVAVGPTVLRLPMNNELTFTAGYSSVAFIPGIEASRLYKPDYEGGSDQLWEPGENSDAEQLSMNTDGTSVRDDVYARDVIDEGYGVANIYKSFLDDLEQWKSDDDLFVDYAVIPYDWRLSFDDTPFSDDLLRGGFRFPDGRLYYAGPLAATNTPYIVQELRRLAATSYTGKVTIVAHSMGGLVAKSQLRKLGPEVSSLVDQIIFVAVPQVGTPKAIGGLLHGFDQGLPKDWAALTLSPQMARTMGRNMPTVYTLLPSASYFTQVDNPVVTFSSEPLLSDFRSRYGDLVHSKESLHTFVSDTWRTAASSPSNLEYPSVGNEQLLTRAENLHNILDAWVPPTGVELTQIAGWGEETVATIEYRQGGVTLCANFILLSGCHTYFSKIEYKPKVVIDGDGTVLVPSALWTQGAQRYWLDLNEYNDWLINNTIPGEPFNRSHPNILEITELRILIKNLVTGSLDAPPDYIFTSQPPNDSPETRLHFTLHSPLSLDLYDVEGHHTGISSTTGQLDETIPGSRYETFGELKWISVPADAAYRLIMHGKAAGSFTLDVEEVRGGSILASTTFAAVPSATNSVATLQSAANVGITGLSSLRLDYDGNGTTELTLTPRQNDIVLSDFNPPEGVISVDLATKDLKVEGKDAEGSTTVSKTGTSTYVIIDQGGNTTKLVFQKTYSGKLLTFARLTGIQYNNSPMVTLPKTSFLYLWQPKNNPPTLLSQTVAVNQLFAIEALYDAKKLKTTTIIFKKGQSTQKLTFPGLRIVKLTTDKGVVGYAP